MENELIEKWRESSLQDRAELIELIFSRSKHIISPLYSVMMDQYKEKGLRLLVSMDL